MGWNGVSMGCLRCKVACKRGRNGPKTVRKGRKRAVFRVNVSKTRPRNPFSSPCVLARWERESALRAESRFSFGTFRAERGRGGCFFTTKHNGAAAPGAKRRRFSLVNTSFAPADRRFFLSASEKQTNRPRGLASRLLPRFPGPGRRRRGPAFLKKMKAFARFKPCLYICKCFHRKIISTK